MVVVAVAVADAGVCGYGWLQFQALLAFCMTDTTFENYCVCGIFMTGWLRDIATV